jgi:hypothetical protein
MTLAEFIFLIAIVAIISYFLRPIQNKLESYLVGYFSKKNSKSAGTSKSERSRN